MQYSQALANHSVQFSDFSQLSLYNTNYNCPLNIIEPHIYNNTGPLSSKSCTVKSFKKQCVLFWIQYTALIWSAKNFALQPSWRAFVPLKICAFKHSNYIFITTLIYIWRMLFLRYHVERENQISVKYTRVHVVVFNTHIHSSPCVLFLKFTSKVHVFIFRYSHPEFITVFSGLGSNPGLGMWESCQWLGARRWFSLGTLVSSTIYNWLVTN